MTVALIGTLASGSCAGRRPIGVPLGTRMDAPDLGALANGGRQRFTVALQQPETIDLRVTFEDAPFNGTQLNVRVNGVRLPPYFAFGGDTRYDAVRGQAGVRPPVALIEGRWLVPPALLRAGDNVLEIWTDGAPASEALERLGPAPATRIRAVTVRSADGTDLPRYANSIYYDFAVWPQGYAWGPDGTRRFHYDNALLGIVNGQGMPVIVPSLPVSERALWEVKRQAERHALEWGYGNQEFYTIWEFNARPDTWARFVDVDGNPETQSRFHGQTIENAVQANDPSIKGADVVLYDPELFARTLEPAIRALAPYATYYNFKCEQHGPWGQGFGNDGQRWAEQGYDGDAWASNYFQAMKAARDLVQKYDAEDGRIQEQNHWMPSIRAALFDTAVRRGEPMREMIDILMTHFTSIADYDLDADGRAIPGETMHLQYPGGTFAPPPRPGWIGHVAREGFTWYKDALYPEVAIDFNRYRLGRTESDMTLADPATHRWGNGQPFDYRAGFRGDELMYNSENGIWQGYSAPSAYQYLQGVFAYGLLPTGAAEPRDLTITTRQSITQTTDVHVNLYGEWVEGVAHTKRLRTVDPLYGDLFGWTGNEHCNAGDYITMVGIKDHHHRRPPHDAYGLVRRMAYAFMTTGPVLPAYLNAGHDETLFVKTLLQVFEGQPYFAIYAANFDERPRELDLTLATPLPEGAEALVFDDRAWDWSSARRQRLPAGSELRYRQTIPALGAWMVLIPASPAALAETLHLPPPPRPFAPDYDAALEGRPTLTWVVQDRSLRYVVEVAREAVFRPVDLLERSSLVSGGSYTMLSAPPAQGRYFWRVASVDSRGRRGPWSELRWFVYQWPEYSEAFPPQASLPPRSAPWQPQPVGGDVEPWQQLSDEHRLEARPNLAWGAEVFGSGGHMHAASRAADGQAFSYWTNGLDEGNSRFELPAEWALLWPEPVRISRIRILWYEQRLPRSFSIQASDDGESWRDLLSVAEPAELLTDLRLPQPVRARYLRIHIPQAAAESGEVGIREVQVR